MESLCLPYFPFKTTLTPELKILTNYYASSDHPNDTPALALGLYTYTLSYIYSTEGYFMKADTNTYNALARECGVNVRTYEKFVGRCLQFGIFDRLLYNTQHILTSEQIQETRIHALMAGKKNVTLIYKYTYASVRKKLSEKFEIVENNEENGKIRYKKIERREEESPNTKLSTSNKERDSIKDTTQSKSTFDSLSNDKVDLQSETVFLNVDKRQEDYNYFLSKFPGKCNLELAQVPVNIDIRLLADKISESPFLQACGNLNLEWMTNKKNYQKVISGGFNKFKNVRTGKNESSFEQLARVLGGDYE